MENRQQQILSEIKEMMSSIRLQLEQLDSKMAELQYEVDPQSFTMDPIDLNLDVLPVAADVAEPVVEPVFEPVAEALIEPVAELVEEPVEDPIEEFVELAEEVVEEVPEEEPEQMFVEEDLPADDDLPFFEVPEPETVFQSEPVLAAEPITVHVAAQAAAAERPVVLDAMTAKQAWRTDMPGASVRDVRSAISLNDRVLFINRLFDEDPVAFQETLTAVNQMETLDDAVNYLVQKFPLWNLDSELVYRFMMALRRKLN